jgi:membrane fusion protein (multidrug efflux system)
MAPRVLPPQHASFEAFPVKIMRRPLFVSFLPAALAASMIVGCGSNSETKPPSPGAAKPAESKPGDQPKPGAAAGGPAKPMGLPVKAEPVKVGPVQNEITAVGTLLPAESVVIRSEIPGRVVSLNFQEGQGVAKGAKLVSLDPSEYQARLAGSTADATKERQRYERAKELLAQKFVSQDAVDVAKGSMDVALAKQQQDEVALAKTTITAPFGGIVGLRLISPGAYVKAGDDIVRLENVGSLKLDFRVPELYVSKLKPGLSVSIRTDAFPSDVFEGRIYAIEPTVDEKSRTVLARAQVPNGQSKLKPGMFGRVSILLESRPKAIIIPEEAIWPQGRDAFVYKIVDGKAMLTKVQLGIRRPGEVEVVQGLGENDVVMTDGQMKMKDGAPVMVLPRPPATASGPAPGAAPAGAKQGG